MLKSKKLLFLTLALVLAVTISSFGAGFLFARGQSPQPNIPIPPELRSVAEIWNVIREEHVDRKTLDPEKLRQGAIKGLLDTLNDPHTSYLNAQQYRLQTSELQGSFFGIGAELGLRDSQLIVVAPFPNSPAERSGVRPGDKILSVDGLATKGVSLPEAVLKIRGPKGAKVVLTVLHDGDETPVDIAVIRDEIRTRSVILTWRGDNIAHIRLTTFAQRTEEELKAALEEIRSKGGKGIILDLRNNGGGLLTAAVGVSSQFLSGGLVLTEEDYTGRRSSQRVIPGGLALETPLVVLVNNFSASASEIVAGALQDQGRATVIGTVTFGKGTINHVRELQDGSALYISIARWFTPKGRKIEGAGITPDMVVAISEEDRAQGADPQLQRGLDYLAGLH
ncbi:MAG: S41 family peptidase [Chloroflexi bacterium]|nr:S41 family peptidase [Chloroflexota bacterium]MBI4216558.1 S41 family peptidase [Chloroflexota bacterium]